MNRRQGQSGLGWLALAGAAVGLLLILGGAIGMAHGLSRAGGLDLADPFQMGGGGALLLALMAGALSLILAVLGLVNRRRLKSVAAAGAILSTLCMSMAFAAVTGVMVWSELATMDDGQELPDMAFRKQAQSEVAALRIYAEEWADGNGAQLTPQGPVEVAALDDGGARRHTVDLSEGQSVVIVAGCDEDCLELHLTLENDAGEAVLSYQEDDAQPVLVVPPSAGGHYSLLAEMAYCEESPCAYGWQILVSDTELPSMLAEGEGTCFAVDSQGLLMTAWHVVADSARMQVTLADGREVEGRLFLYSEATDLALVKVDVPTPDHLTLGDSSRVAAGDWVFTLGYPVIKVLGVEAKFAEGNIASLTGLEGDATYFQISVPVHPGNSGGPLVNEAGQVIGVVTSMAAALPFYAATGVLPQNVSWAVKGDYARPLLAGKLLERPPALSRSQAIDGVRRALCRVRTGS